MLTKIWYQFIKYYVKTAFYFYYKKINVVGYENIPKKGAVLFVCNHPNALIDPLLIKTHTNKDLYVLTRAGVFSNKVVIKIFESVKMLPIYRKRDGFKVLSKNDAIFEKCYDLLNDKKAILIFVEGSHSILRKVRPLTKGFTRISFGALKKYPDLDVQIVPIGLNYLDATKYPDSVSIHFGKPISAKEHYNADDLLSSADSLKEATLKQMKKLVTHIEGDSEVYQNTYKKLITLNADFTDPIKTNNLIQKLNQSESVSKNTRKKSRKNLLYYLVFINSCIPWLTWNKLRKGIQQDEFIATFRYAVSVVLFPLTYIIQSFILYAIFDKKVAFIYFLASIFSSFILSKTLKVND